MDNRLVLIVLFVTLSWMSVNAEVNGTGAPVSVTGAPVNVTGVPVNATGATVNATGATVNATGAPVSVTGATVNATGTTVNATGTPVSATGAPVNATGAPVNATGTTVNATGTTVNATGTTVNATGAPVNATGTTVNATGTTVNATGAPGNATGAPGNATGAPGNATGAPGNATGAPGNATGAPGNVTGAPGNATGSPGALIPNTTVETLATTLSRIGCGTEQLCAAQPSECNPSNEGSCFFLSARQQSNSQNFDFGLAGFSEGYVATTLSTSTNVGNNDTTYVCANNNGVVKFFSALLNGGKLIQTVLSVNSVRGRVNGTKIQCTFAATVVTPSTKAPAISISINTGTFNSTSGELGNPIVQFRSGLVDLGNPNASVTNTLNSNTTNTTTTPPNTTSHAITFQQSLMKALLITVGVLGLAML